MPGVGGKFSLEWREWRFGRMLLGLKEELHELRTYKVDGGRAERGFFDAGSKGESVFGSAGRSYESAAGWRSGKRAEVEASDNSKSAERADEKFMEVIAGDVLDHAAAAFAETAGAVNEFRADEEIASSAVGMAKRGIDAGSDDAADRGFKIKRDGKRQKLFLIVERYGEVVEIGSGIDAEGEVAGIVVSDFVEAGHIEGEVVARGRHADAEFGAIAAGDKGEMFESGEANDFGDLFGGGWFCDGGRSEFVDGVQCADSGA
jgi:hypothetical protein